MRTIPANIEFVDNAHEIISHAFVNLVNEDPYYKDMKFSSNAFAFQKGEAKEWLEDIISNRARLVIHCNRFMDYTISPALEQ